MKINWFKKEEKKVKYPKPKKKLVELLPKRINQKTANRLFSFFIVGLVVLAVLTILSNALGRSEKQPVAVAQKDSRNLSNKVGLFMSDFLSAYFSSKEESENVQKFYGKGIDVKNTSFTQEDSKLTSAVLIEIKENLATYRISYSVKADDEWKENSGVINVPYAEKNGKFYVSDLPYFTNEGSYTAHNATGSVQLNQQSERETKKYQKAAEYTEAFFKAYTSGDETQMSPFSKEIQPVKGYSFESLDYTYFVEEKKQLVVIAQVTLKDGLNLVHQENFTLFLEKESKHYSVKKMEHGASSEYRNKEKE